MSEVNLCKACFEDIPVDASKCPNCGYDRYYTQSPSCLKIDNVLKDTYRVGACIYANGESVTYYGYNMLSDNKVIIKEYFPDYLSKRDDGEKNVTISYGNEVQFKAMLHDFIQLSSDLMKLNELSCLSEIQDIFYENNTGYVVFKYEKTISLRTFVSGLKKDLSFDQAKKMMDPLALSLEVLHEHGIVHRYINPDTIMITENGEFKLTDFASPAARTENGEFHTKLNPRFTAPEQCKADGWQGDWTDVFGFASCFYFLLTRSEPDEISSRLEKDNLVSVSLLNNKVQRAYSNAIIKGMSLNSKERYQSIGLFMDAFENKKVLETAEVIDDSERPWYLKKWMFAVYSFGATVILLLILLFIMWIFLGPNDTKENISSSSSSPSTSSEAVENKVPNFVGKTIAQIDADDNLSKYKLTVTEAYHDTVTVGTIISQDPIAESKYEEGKPINVITSKGPKSISMPDIVGKTSADASEKLKSSEILFDIYEVYDETAVEGTVVRTSFAAGAMVTPSKERVKVFVCKK